MQILVKSRLGGYTTNPEWVMEEYKNHLARKIRLAKRGKTEPSPRTDVNLDNSEPWMENPKTVDDLIWIAQQVNQLAEQWKPK